MLRCTRGILLCAQLDTTVFVRHPILRRYASLKGNSAYLSQLVAVMAGIKPAMDDWIPVARVKAIMELLKDIGLHVVVDNIFLPERVSSHLQDVEGSLYLNTTIGYGFPWSISNRYLLNRDGLAHVFISREARLLETVRAHGWYPVIWKDRVVHKPWIDHARFGQALGYPDCCIRQFVETNDWRRNASYAVSLQLTVDKPSFLANPFAKHTLFSYISHIPCSFSCRNTISLANAIRDALKSFDLELVLMIDDFLKQKFLHISEDEIYCLVDMDGMPDTYYAFYRRIPSSKAVNNSLEHLLLLSDNIYVEDADNYVVVGRKGESIVGRYRVSCQPSAFPYVIRFS